MKHYEVIVTPDAEEDLREIYAYIAHSFTGRTAALSQARTIRKDMKSLQTMPARAQLMSEEPWKSRGVRRLLAGNYYIYYRIDEKLGRVYVLNVIFARRDQMHVLKHSPKN